MERHQTSDEQVKFYHQNGYLPPIRLFSEDVAAQHQKLFNEIEKKVGREKCENAHRMTGKFIFEDEFGQPFVWDIASSPILLDVIEKLLGSFYLLNNTRFFCKYENSNEKYIAWHQDLTYMLMDPPELITAWYAIDDADEENGCVQVIPGSHKTKEFFPHGESRDGGNLLNRNQEVLLTDDMRSKVISIPCKKGEALIFSGFLLHGSQPNHSSRRRCGLAVRYVPVSSKPNHEKIQSGILMRGGDPYNYYQVVGKPF